MFTTSGLRTNGFTTARSTPMMSCGVQSVSWARGAERGGSALMGMARPHPGARTAPRAVRPPLTVRGPDARRGGGWTRRSVQLSNDDLHSIGHAIRTQPGEHRVRPTTDDVAAAAADDDDDDDDDDEEEEVEVEVKEEEDNDDDGDETDDDADDGAGDHDDVPPAIRCYFRGNGFQFPDTCQRAGQRTSEWCR
eukprot:gene11147-biopygen3336